MSNFKKVEKNKNNIFVGKVKCPECKSINTVASNNMANYSLLTFIICSIGFSISLIIPFLGWIAAPIFLLISLGSIVTLILSTLTKEYTFKCNDCESEYKIKKSEYKDLVKNKNI
ncbi:MAG: hypothetical protein U0N84_11855 [Terrisporobacter sp.]|jgi:hypothetical protein|uniref:hypothetical protein n=1 Tax=Terrisporobacter sp. TaxID=1965305 RepID=UPI002F948812